MAFPSPVKICERRSTPCSQERHHLPIKSQGGFFHVQCTRFPRGTPERFSSHRGSLSVATGAALHAAVVRRADRKRVRQARQPLRRDGLLDRRHGLVLSGPSSARRQGGLLPSGRGPRRGASATNGRRGADLRYGRLLPGAGQVVRRGVARAVVRDRRGSSAAGGCRLALEGPPRQARRRLRSALRHLADR